MLKVGTKYHGVSELEAFGSTQKVEDTKGEESDGHDCAMLSSRFSGPHSRRVEASRHRIV